MSEPVILSFRVRFGRGTRAQAAQIARSVGGAALAAAYVVGSDSVELWLHEPSEELVTRMKQLEGIKNVDFTGTVTIEQSKAPQVVMAQRAFSRNAILRRPHGPSATSIAIERWWSDVAQKVELPRMVKQ